MKHIIHIILVYMYGKEYLKIMVISMLNFECYNNSVLELNILKKRLDIIKKAKENLLNEEKNIKETINLYVNKTNSIKKNLSELKGIEYELYSEIVINGLNVSKAVEKVAEKNEKDVSTIWKNYYPKIKTFIEI